MIGDLFSDPQGQTVLNPRSLLFDSVGNLIVSGTGSNNIVRISSGPLVSLSGPSNEPITVDYTIADGTAISSEDYSGVSGTLTFAPGQTSKRVWLTTVDDLMLEGDETLTVTLSNPSVGATLGDSLSNVTITDDDVAREVWIDDVSEVEGDRTTHYRGPFIQKYPVAKLHCSPSVRAETSIFPGDRIERFDGITGELIDAFFIDNRRRRQSQARGDWGHRLSSHRSEWSTWRDDHRPGGAL